MGLFLATTLLAAAGAATCLGFGGFALTSLVEREWRAATLSAALAALGVAVILLGSVAPPGLRESLAAVTLALAVCLLTLLLAPIGRVVAGPRVPAHRFDERDIMYARAELKPGTPAYAAYYGDHPDRQAGDDRMRALPGLLSPESLMAAGLPFAAADAAFGVTMALTDALDGEPAEQQVSVDPGEATAFVKGLARYWGARDVGITELRDYHLYSHRGMDQERFGESIDGEHAYAVAIAAELEHEMLHAAPEAPVIMESGRSYLRAGTVAVQLAEFIRSLGYPATAHIVDHYTMVAPLVARDAGLGEIGRSGVLISRRLGPRVRLAFVTTDLPLHVDDWRTDTSVLDFCARCSKCADACPARAIPAGEREMTDGALRWRIDPDRCYTYWCKLGTDCGRCVAVCPYSHPDTPMHRLVRLVNARSGAARQITLWLDDAFYGRRPRPATPPSWIPERVRRGPAAEPAPAHPVPVAPVEQTERSSAV